MRLAPASGQGQADRRWPLLLLLVLVGIVYSNSLAGPFHYDDEHSIVRNQALQSLRQIPEYFVDLSSFSGDEGKGMYRPLLLVTYAINHVLHGYDVVGFHLVNIGLHAACVMLVWSLSCRLYPHHRTAAWLGAALFAVHPVAAEPVNYISSRSETLMAVFFLLTLLLHLRRGPESMHPWAAGLSFALALLSKETAIVLIPVLLMMDVWGPRRGGASPCVGVMMRRHGLYWILGGIYLAILFWTGFLGHPGGEPVRGGLEQALTQVKAPVYYAQLLVLPSLLSVDHAFQVSEGVSASVLAAVAILVTAAFLVLRGRLRAPHLFLSAGVSLLVLLPTSIVPLNILVNERRIYLVLAILCVWLPRRLPRRATPAMVAGIILLAGLTMQRNEVWASPLALWENATDHGSRSYTAFVNLGKARQGAGDAAGAAAAYRRALSINDRQGDVYNNLAVLLHESGNPRDAIPYYVAAVKRSPGMEEIYHNLAIAQQEIGDLAAARATLGQALELNPGNGGLWSNFGQLLLQADDPAGAETAYREAVRLLGDRAEPYNGLGNALSAQGRSAAAIQAYDRALSVAADPTQRAVILTNLGESLMRDQQSIRARQVLQAALGIEPSAAAYDYLGRLALADADTAGAWESWQAAVRADPTRPVPFTGLGEIAAARGELEKAGVLFQRAIGAGGGRRAKEGLLRVQAMTTEAGR